MQPIVSEYLSLIQLTELFLLEKAPRSFKPVKTSPQPVPPTPEIKQAPPVEIKPKILERPKTPPPPKPKEEPLVIEKQDLPKKKGWIQPPNLSKIKGDLTEMKELLHKACPHISLTDPIEKVCPVILLMNEENEKTLLENLASALQKEGIPTQLEPSLKWQLSKEVRAVIATSTAIRAATHLHPYAKRDEKGNLFFATLPVFPIADLQKMIDMPDLRRAFWTKLMQNLK